MDAREMAKSMKKAEDRGFEMGFFSETIELMRDSVTAIAAIGLNTTKMSLGWTQIVRLRSPVIMAQSLASLDELTQGRVYLAPGACTKGHAQVHSLERIKPILTLTEWVESMRLLLTGEKISYHGEVIHLDDVQLGFTPFRKEIPLLIPATSTVGLKLAGNYQTAERAVYWDGRNANGESVSSGVYFYRLQAGDYSQSHKMVILK